MSIDFVVLALRFCPHDLVIIRVFMCGYLWSVDLLVHGWACD